MEEEGKTRAPGENSEPSEAPHIPTWEEFRESFLTAGIPEEWLLKQFAWYEENRAWLTPGGLLKLWKFQVRRRWASDRMSWKPAGKGPEKKSAASPAQQLFAVSRELEDLEKKLDALHERDAEIDPKDRERERELRRLKAELEQGGNDPSSATR